MSKIAVAVLGAGTMGNGIAQVFAQHGHPVTLRDLATDILDRARGQIAKSLGRLAERGKLTAADKKVFVDLKLHDIGHTVARGVESLSSLGATFLTVHAYPQTMQAAVEARGRSGPKILAVTVLTSYNEMDLQASGYRLGIAELVAARADQAKALGVDGLVCSPEEAAALRAIVGDRMSLVTPGIRPAGTASGRRRAWMACQGRAAPRRSCPRAPPRACPAARRPPS